MNGTGKHAGQRTYIATIAIGMTLFAACASGETTTLDAIDALDAAEVAVAAEAPAYTIGTGDTLSGIAARAGVSLDDLVAANGWSDGDDHLILPGDVIALPDGAIVEPNGASPSATTATGDDPTSTQATSTPEASTPATSDDSTGTPATGGYRPASFEMGLADDRTEPVTLPLGDGVYYSPFLDSDGSTVTFTLGQWFWCSDMSTVPPDVDCGGGVGSLTEPSAQVTMASDADIIVATGHIDNQTFARVNAVEYARITDGYLPAADAPAGYEFHLNNHAFVRVSGGVVVQVQQFYMS